MAESVMFVQPPGSVPIPLPVNATGHIIDAGKETSQLVVSATANPTSLVVSAVAGVSLKSALCVGGNSNGWLLIYDSATKPADGAVTPIMALPIASGIAQSFSLDYPHLLTNGCTLVFSTTGPFTQTTSVGTCAFLAGQAS